MVAAVCKIIQFRLLLCSVCQCKFRRIGLAVHFYHGILIGCFDIITMAACQIFIGMEYLHLVFPRGRSLILKFQIIRIAVRAFHPFHIFAAGGPFAVGYLDGFGQCCRDRVFRFNDSGMLLGRQCLYQHIIQSRFRSRIYIHHINSLLQVNGGGCHLPVCT